MITAAPTTDPVTEIRSGAPFFGGEEPGASTGGTPMEGSPTEVRTKAELGVLEERPEELEMKKINLGKKIRNTSLTLKETRKKNSPVEVVSKRHDAGKTSGGQQQNGYGRRQTGRGHGRRRASRAKTKRTITPRHRERRRIGRRRRRKSGSSTATKLAVAARLCSSLKVKLGGAGDKRRRQHRVQGKMARQLRGSWLLNPHATWVARTREKHGDADREEEDSDIEEVCDGDDDEYKGATRTRVQGENWGGVNA
ncbi:hypothetical protein PIB30_082404 [Stylosanthes scabra]|uniref:Uncharacterized protein n=1 Tax=Stylosanthes scabra TaxID=79078 RepID=A0ABU6WVE4_9FABA|nr:hypothetical protein [Stylosanthes scabra]